MAQYDVNRVNLYYNITPISDIPTWAHGMKWYYNPQAEQTQFDNFPADFGIEEDWLAVRAERKSWRTPFAWAKNLWPRIEERKRRLAALNAALAPETRIEPAEGASNSLLESMD